MFLVAIHRARLPDPSVTALRCDVWERIRPLCILNDRIMEFVCFHRARMYEKLCAIKILRQNIEAITLRYSVCVILTHLCKRANTHSPITGHVNIIKTMDWWWESEGQKQADSLETFPWTLGGVNIFRSEIISGMSASGHHSASLIQPCNPLSCGPQPHQDVMFV